MKSLKTTLFLSFALFVQTTIQAQNVFNTGAGTNVGIGTTSPVSSLEVKNGFVLFDGTTGTLPSTGAGTRMMWYPAKSAFRAGTITGTQWDDASIGQYSTAFGYNTKASAATSAAFGSTTNASGGSSFAVGVLGVASGTGSTTFGWNSNCSANWAYAMGLALTSNSYGAFYIGAYNAPISPTPNLTSWVPTDPLFVIGNGVSGSPSNAMTVLKNGKVGIGITTPAALLDVNGVAKFNTLTIGSPTGATNERICINYDGSVAVGRYNVVTGVGVSFGTDGVNDRMVITQAGNVGIGTSWQSMYNNPNGYKLAVNGTIGAKAITLEATSATWSDYVFEKNYKLKTLEELEVFINTNKHLPNVPSACEVEEKGIDVVTMDATLLAKIEELSLYIIEQNKKLEAQNARIEALEKDNK